ncbi:MAG: flippase [Egibacteraceae bacterium]
MRRTAVEGPRTDFSEPDDPGQYRDEVLGLSGGGGLNLVGAAFNNAMRFAITFLLARLLGSDDVGLYFQALAFLAVLDLLSLSGFRGALTRFVAVHRADQDPGSLRGTLHLGLAISIGAAAVLGAALFALAPVLAQSAFHDPRLTVPLRLVAVALPPTVFTDAALAATVGFKTMRGYVLIGLVFEPAFRILLTVALLAAGRGIEGAMEALVVTNVIAAILAGLALKRLVGPPTAPAQYQWRELFAFSTVSWVAKLASIGLLWVDTILLGLYRSASEVGVYHVATRVVLMTTILMQPLNTAFAPRIAELYWRGQRESLNRMYHVVTGWILRLALPAFVTLIVFPRELLSIFGRDFQAGATVTVLLAVGQLFDVATGPCGSMLVMSGRPRLTMIGNIAGLGLNVGLNLWLIPRYGIMGAGVAWAVSLVVVNVTRVVLVWLTMRMVPFDRDLAKALAATVGALAVALAVRHAAEGLVALGVGVAALGVVYVGVVVALGISTEDRLVLGTLKSRLRLSLRSA